MKNAITSKSFDLGCAWYGYWVIRLRGLSHCSQEIESAAAFYEGGWDWEGGEGGMGGNIKWPARPQ